MAFDTLKNLGIDSPYKERYDNYIGGKWVKPVDGKYFENITPLTGKPFCEVARSSEADVNLALDAAHAAKDAWGKTSPTERANILNKIADAMEQNLEKIALAETIDNGKPIRETMAADIPLAIDHFRYFAGAIRAQEGSVCEIDHETVAYHFHEPLGVVGQIIPWNFPILMAAWKLAPCYWCRKLCCYEACGTNSSFYYGGCRNYWRSSSTGCIKLSQWLWIRGR